MKTFPERTPAASSRVDGGPTAVHRQPASAGEFPIGHVLDGRFQIRVLIAQSGMATIYRAQDLANENRDVAIKVPLPRFESDPAYFARFRHEEEMGIKLDHPSLVKVYPVTGQKSRPYLAMEFLHGHTLAHRLREKKRLPEAAALRIAAQICGALEYLHSSGFIHRDLKPSNVMLCEDGALKLFDFGLASPPIRQRSALARLGSTFGTPEYMAPEQVENGAIEEKADIYGLGAILYEMLTGQVPFRRDDPWDSAFARINGDPVAPRMLNPNISPAAEEIVLHAMQRDPKDRYGTAAAFRADLEAPQAVAITGYCHRLRPPKWRLSFQATPILAGALLGVAMLTLLVGAFLLIWFFTAHR